MATKNSLPSIEATAQAAGTVKPQETPEQTMARIKSELAAKGEKTGALRQLDVERAAGIPSVVAPGPGIPQSATVPPPSFTSSVQNLVENKANDYLKQQLGAPESFDNQIIRAQAAMYKTLLGESLTPEELRWLSPSQQQAIRSGNDSIIKQELAATNFIKSERTRVKQEEEDRKQKAQQEALTKFKLLSDVGALDQVSGEDAVQIEKALGLAPGGLAGIAAKQGTSKFSYEKLGNELVELELDKNTGQILSQRVITSGGEEDGLTAKDRLDAALKLYDSGQANSLDEAYGMITNLASSGQTYTGTTGKLQVQIGNEVRSGGSASWRNNNPGNIKYSDENGNLTAFASSLVSQGIDIQQGSKAMDGGYFIAFPTLEGGSSAMKQLLSGGTYSKLPLDEALKRWSNSGYGAEILPPEIQKKSFGDLNSDEKQEVIQRMIQREGFTPGSVQKAGQTSQTQVEDAIRQGLANIKPSLGSVTAQKDLQQTINSQLSQGRIEDAKETLQQAALSTLKGAAFDKEKGRYGAIQNLKKIQTLLNQYAAQNGDLSVFGGTNLLSGKVEKFQENVLKTTNNPALANIANQIQLAIIDYRSSVSGAAFTESELKQYNQVFPSIENTPTLNTQKINSLLDVFQRNQKSSMEFLIGPKTYQNIFTEDKKFMPVIAPVNESKVRSTLQNTKTVDGDPLTTEEVNYIVSKMVQFSSQGNSQQEITNWVNQTLGF